MHGKARAGPVMGKVIAEHPSLRARIGEVREKVGRVVEEVNKLDRNSLVSLAERLQITIRVEKGKEERRWPPLENADSYGLIVTRMAPEPNGYPTLGHVKGLLVPFIYARLYKGKFLLRFEDTNPRVEKLEYYEALRRELGLILEAAEAELGLSPGRWDEEVIESCDIPRMYELAERLIADGNAYICMCPARVVRKNRKNGISCEHRDLSRETNLELWRKMLEGEFKEGEVHLRLNTDIEHPNRTMRDPGIFRIVEHPHPIHGDKYLVYPTYDFSVSVEDALTGVTHAHRSKEFETHAAVQSEVVRMLGLRRYEMIQFGRVTVQGVPLSKRFLRHLVRARILEWDDPRLPTIRGVLKRGIDPRALVRFFYELGPSKVDATISMDAIFAHNRKIVDPLAPRYMFVPDPIRLTMFDVPHDLMAKVKVHPDKPELGARDIVVKREMGKAFVYMPSSDAQELEDGDEIRLWCLGNVRIRSVLADEVTSHYLPGEKTDVKVIQWAPSSEFTPAKVFKPISVYSYEMRVGFGEPAMRELKPRDRVQLFRFGFAVVDDIKEGTVELIFSHK